MRLKSVNQKRPILHDNAWPYVMKNNSVEMEGIRLQNFISPSLLTRPLFDYLNNFSVVPELQGLIWFGSFLWHINHCRLFNAESLLYEDH